MKLIVGLGNPGKKYEKTRHNVGFMFVDELASKLNEKFVLDKVKKCEIIQSVINNEKIIVMKPQTFMNLSGEAVNIVSKYYNIETDDILVIYDDMDLDVARMKIKPAGSSGGHKGMQNIIDNLKTPNIKRIRIGISKSNIDTIDYVLGKFSKDDKIDIDLTISKAYDIINDFVSSTFDNVMNRYNHHE